MSILGLVICHSSVEPRPLCTLLRKAAAKAKRHSGVALLPVAASPAMAKVCPAKGRNRSCSSFTTLAATLAWRIPA
jgi:hypothetical protein